MFGILQLFWSVTLSFLECHFFFLGGGFSAQKMILDSAERLSMLEAARL